MATSSLNRAIYGEILFCVILLVYIDHIRTIGSIITLTLQKWQQFKTPPCFQPGPNSPEGPGLFGPFCRGWLQSQNHRNIGQNGMEQNKNRIEYRIIIEGSLLDPPYTSNQNREQLKLGPTRQRHYIPANKKIFINNYSCAFHYLLQTVHFIKGF